MSRLVHLVEHPVGVVRQPCREHHQLVVLRHLLQKLLRVRPDHEVTRLVREVDQRLVHVQYQRVHLRVEVRQIGLRGHADQRDAKQALVALLHREVVGSEVLQVLHVVGDCALRDVTNEVDQEHVEVPVRLGELLVEVDQQLGVLAHQRPEVELLEALQLAIGRQDGLNFKNLLSVFEHLAALQQ